MFNVTTIGAGLGSGPSRLLAWGLGWWDRAAAVTAEYGRRFIDHAAEALRRREDEEVLTIIQMFLSLEGK